MNKINKINLSLLVLFSSLSTVSLHARKYWFNRPALFDYSLFDELERMHKHLENQLFSSAGVISKDDKKFFKKAKEALSKIKPEITKDENGNITIMLPIENIDKSAIEDITLEDNTLRGAIPTKYGTVEFFIFPKYIEVVRKIEIKKEEKDSKDKKDKQDKNKDKKKTKFTAYHVGSYSTSESLPVTVDLSTAKAETKEDKLIIRFSPKKYTKISVQHS